MENNLKIGKRSQKLYNIVKKTIIQIVNQMN